MNYPPARCPKPASAWIMQVPVISTGHFPKEDCDLLFADEPMMHSTSFDPPSVLLAIEDPEDNLPWDKLSITTRGLIKSFHELGYRYLRLDRDGDTISDRTTFNW